MSYSHQDWKTVTIRKPPTKPRTTPGVTSVSKSSSSTGFVAIDENGNEKVIRKHCVSKDEARKIVIARNKLGLTQQEVADKAGISKDTMSKIENPQNLTRNAQMMSKIYKVLGL